ncbi:hypothetical protein ACFLT8_05935 [Chloroflexota bacterium]
MDTLIEIMKWVGIALAAGFIGYLGRYLAMMIIDRTLRKQIQPTLFLGRPKEISTSPDTGLEQNKIKVEKKRAKAEAKRTKKGQKE